MATIPPGEYLSPFETQRRIHELFAQETRHRILLTIMGHPAHLPSLAELAYYTQKSESAVLDQLAQFEERGIVTSYSHDAGKDAYDLPGTFYGLTERGVLTLGKFDYLRGVPVLRAMHDATAKTEQIRRHEDAPRPDLPAAVREALGLGDSGPGFEGPELAGELARASVQGDEQRLRELFD